MVGELGRDAGLDVTELTVAHRPSLTLCVQVPSRGTDKRTFARSPDNGKCCVLSNGSVCLLQLGKTTNAKPARTNHRHHPFARAGKVSTGS